VLVAVAVSVVPAAVVPVDEVNDKELLPHLGKATAHLVALF